MLPAVDSCENVTCRGGRHCAQDQNGVPHCVRCRTHCRSTSSPSQRVCGGDGQTYSSLCALERHTCLTGRTIRLAYRGNCRRAYIHAAPPFSSLMHSINLQDCRNRVHSNMASRPLFIFPFTVRCTSTHSLMGNDAGKYSF